VHAGMLVDIYHERRSWVASLRTAVPSSADLEGAGAMQRIGFGRCALILTKTLQF